MFTALMSFGNPPSHGDFSSHRTFNGSRFCELFKALKKADKISKRTNKNQAFKSATKIFETTNRTPEFLIPTAKTPI